MSKWTDEELAELEHSQDLDWETAEWLPPSPPRGAVVTISLGAEEFERIAACAEGLGETLTAFIKRAASERAEREAQRNPAPR
jgi:hypothetical protein